MSLSLSQIIKIVGNYGGRNVTLTIEVWFFKSLIFLLSISYLIANDFLLTDGDFQFLIASFSKLVSVLNWNPGGGG